MLKKIILIIGIILTFLGSAQGFRYITQYQNLTEYGKGYVWGSVILIVIGVLMIIFGSRKKRR